MNRLPDGSVTTDLESEYIYRYAQLRSLERTLALEVGSELAFSGDKGWWDAPTRWEAFHRAEAEAIARVLRWRKKS